MGTSANAERRESTRRRFNGTVELALPDEAEGYEADAIDLSIGGISLKTAFLPDVGSELDCRFVLDGNDPRTVQARGQVVWAKDNGNDAGAFGLCFTELSKGDRAALEKHCTPKSAQPAQAAQAPVDPHAKTVNVNVNAVDDRVRLRLPKMSEPLKAKVQQQVDGAVVVAMDLSFITLGDNVEVESVKGKTKGILEDVQVDVDASSKSARLVLTVSLDGSTAAERTGRHAALVMPSKPTPVAPQEAQTIAAKPVKKSAPVVVASRHDEDEHHEAESIKGTGTEVLSSKDGAARADAAAKTSDESSDEESSLASRSSAPAWLVSAMTRLRLTSKAAWEKASPAIKSAFAALVTFAMTFSAKVRARVTGKPVALPEPAKSERVTTAKSAPSASKPALRKQKPEAELAAEASAIDSTAPSMRRKYAMIGLGAFGLSAIVFALATSGRERRPQAPRPQVAVESAPAATPTNSTSPGAAASDAPATNTAANAAAPTGEPENNGAVEPAPANEPSLLQRNRGAMPSDLVAAARSRNANVDSEQPTVRREVPAITPARGARPTVASNTPAPIAANGPVRPLGSPAVRTGTVLRLRLDGPITNLAGGAAGADSISFRVQGRRVLDRAAAFVRMDPRIAGAGAYNRGGNAEFTLRFHGAAPQFNARARGDVLEVTLAAPAATASNARGATRPSVAGVRIASMPRR
ncbi:MAG: PilZ domain-containing protein [Polyangiales bacterium]